MQGGSQGMVALSILLGAILVAAAMFYNTNVLVKKMGGTELTAQKGTEQQAQAQPQPQPQAQAQPQQPSGPVSVTDRGDQPTIGKSNAKVTIYEFSDFQCPFCQRFEQGAYAQIKTNYIDTGKAKLVYRHYPLPFHVNAQKAAEAGECANRQGKFEAYHDMLFAKGQADGTGLAPADLKQYASQVGLDTGKFNKCLDNGETAQVIKDDTAAGTAAGINGTPSFVIGGKLIVGAQDYSQFQAAIDEALKK